MPRFMFIGSYSAETSKTIMLTGGTARRATIEKMVANLGGRLESFDFAFGSDDAYVVCDLPDPGKAAAIALTINGSGMASVRTVLLMTPEELDAVAQVRPNYQPPSTS